MTDYAAIIKQAVPMRDAVERYTGQQIVLNRICCPIHHGKDRNMRIYGRSYYCWVCHASGDVIQFVQAVCGVSFRDAMKRLNEDFKLDLPIGAERNATNRAKLSELNRRIAERKYREWLAQVDSEIDGLKRANLLGLLHTIEVICETERPKTADEEWNPVWCMAMRVRTELSGTIL